VSNLCHFISNMRDDARQQLVGGMQNIYVCDCMIVLI
jgi:hypothetical protein